jgi:hypothetical protein
MTPIGNIAGFKTGVSFPVKPMKLLDAADATGLAFGPAVALPYWPTVVISGIAGGAEIQLQVANDWKAPVWTDLGAAITADGAFVIDTGALLMRAEISNVGTGTITITLGGNPPG